MTCLRQMILSDNHHPNRVRLHQSNQLLLLLHTPRLSFCSAITISLSWPEPNAPGKAPYSATTAHQRIQPTSQ